MPYFVLLLSLWLSGADTRSSQPLVLGIDHIPVVVTDACGAGHEEAARRSIASLAFAGDALLTDVDTICRLFRSRQAAG